MQADLPLWEWEVEMGRLISKIEENLEAGGLPRKAALLLLGHGLWTLEKMQPWAVIPATNETAMAFVS